MDGSADLAHGSEAILKRGSLAFSIGSKFTQHYYQSLKGKLENIVDLYHNVESVLARLDQNELSTPANNVFGHENIQKKVTALGLENCKFKITSVDCQDSLDEGVLVMVTGVLISPDVPPRSFVQTFFLARHNNLDNPSYYVRNDVLRILGTLGYSPKVKTTKPVFNEEQNENKAAWASENSSPARSRSPSQERLESPQEEEQEDLGYDQDEEEKEDEPDSPKDEDLEDEEEDQESQVEEDLEEQNEPEPQPERIQPQPERIQPQPERNQPERKQWGNLPVNNLPAVDLAEEVILEPSGPKSWAQIAGSKFFGTPATPAMYEEEAAPAPKQYVDDRNGPMRRRRRERVTVRDDDKNENPEKIDGFPVFVKNVPENTSDSDIRDAFTQFGEANVLYLGRKCVVYFSTAHEAEAASKGIIMLGQQQLGLSLFTDKPRKAPNTNGNGLYKERRGPRQNGAGRGGRGPRQNVTADSDGQWQTQQRNRRK